MLKMTNVEGTTITTDDFNNICRGCLCDCKNILSCNLHNTLIFENVVADIFARCVSILVSEHDVLPNQLCQQCFEELSNCYKFINKCQRSQQILLSVLSRGLTTIKIEKVETPSDEVIHEEIELGDLKRDPLENADPSFQVPPQPKKQKRQTSEPYVHCEKLKQPDQFRTLANPIPNIEDNENVLEANVQIHANENPYRCNHCGKTYRKLSTIQFHSCIDTEKTIYKCDECDTEYKNRNNLKMHVMTKHSHERPYKCDFCEKTFTWKKGKLIHERTHTGEKPYTCDVCNKEFCDRSNWKRHLGTHSEEKPYKCSFCEKGFGTKMELVYHERVHTGERPYICDVCGKGFTHKGHLNRHILAHTQKKPFICAFCGKGFTRKHQWVDHKKTHLNV